ncbi:MAG TPA: sigma-70 family RNA polymerase sigma factor [Chitinophagaceae bacterium]|nr:sigma-70 family RNA polymerase sigma factor [Chitinophagaceae bacterium]
MLSSKNIHELTDHLFRHESGKMVSVLTKIFGPHNLQLAEDVVQDTLLKAMNTWKMNGLPENPSAWLFTAAKNKALDIIRKAKRQQNYATEISYLLQSEYTLSPTVNELMNKDAIEDDQLRMMFTCCHPSLAPETQVALVLKTLCGFSITEIARAFIAANDTIEKRLYRAKQKFREEKIAFEIPKGSELEERLDNVLIAIYLLFNEGYNSTQHENLIRRDLLEESLRLGELLIQHPATKQPKVFALLALMCFNSARSNARLDKEGNILLLKDQDRSLWDQSLIERGLRFIEDSAAGEMLSAYHLEAAIACEYITAADYSNINWQHILHYYDLLYQLRPTAIVALNRSVVVGELYGPAEGIKAIEKIPGIEFLKNYYLLHAILGEMHFQLDNKDKAADYFSKAALLTASETEKKLLAEKMSQIQQPHL